MYVKKENRSHPSPTFSFDSFAVSKIFYIFAVIKILDYMRKLTLTFIAVVISLTVSAKEVTEQQALLKAQRFMQGKQLRTRNLHRAASAKSNSYYVFNAESNGGFVIVSGTTAPRRSSDTVTRARSAWSRCLRT
jgi:hypothetical protein